MLGEGSCVGNEGGAAQGCVVAKSKHLKPAMIPTSIIGASSATITPPAHGKFYGGSTASSMREGVEHFRGLSTWGLGIGKGVGS